MTPEEYQQLLKSSTSYKELPNEMQDKIIKAEGETQKTYIKIFMEEQTMIIQAKKEYIKKNEQVVLELNYSVKLHQKQELARQEQDAMKQEALNAENLLNNI